MPRSYALAGRSVNANLRGMAIRGRPKHHASTLTPGTRPGTRRVSVILDEAVVVAIDARADLNRRTRSDEIAVILRGHVTSQVTT